VETPVSAPDPFVEDHNDFALAMYGQLRQRPGNLFFSPFSIRSALGMAHAGARGETAREMSKALRLSSWNETPHAGFAEIIPRLNATGRAQHEMAVANSLWGQEGAPFLSDFLDRIAKDFGGGMNHVDFRRAAAAARVTINQWVEEKTRLKIRGLIPPGSVDSDTRLVLVNAVYFKGRWVLEFDRSATRNETFRLEGGGKVKAPLMNQHAEVRYRAAAGYQVDLAYRGKALSMLVLLPDRKSGLRDLESSLSTRMLHDCVAQMGYCGVRLCFPRFKITWGSEDLRDYLSTLGMPLAFTRFRADFSGINGLKPPQEEALFISNVFHKAFVEANEEGTEAAAATAVGHSEVTAPAPAPERIFRADHPFLFAIRDRKSGAILFLGRVADPTQES
jgi:serpin B